MAEDRWDRVARQALDAIDRGTIVTVEELAALLRSEFPAEEHYRYFMDLAEKQHAEDDARIDDLQHRLEQANAAIKELSSAYHKAINEPEYAVLGGVSTANPILPRSSS